MLLFVQKAACPFFLAGVRNFKTIQKLTSDFSSWGVVPHSRAGRTTTPSVVPAGTRGWLMWLSGRKRGEWK
jgi:hypothetical protein